MTGDSGPWLSRISRRELEITVEVDDNQGLEWCFYFRGRLDGLFLHRRIEARANAVETVHS